MSGQTDDIQEATIVQDETFSPLSAPVKQREYTNHTIHEDNSAPLEEPRYEAPKFSDFESIENDASAPTEEKKVFNEAYSELDGKEKKMGAEMMVEITLDIYGKGCGLVGKLPQLSENKLDKLIADGDIDPDISLMTDNGALRVKDFAKGYNESIGDAFEVTEEFKEKVRPPLTRVFQKRGVGATDEQMLAYYFLTDFGTKAFQAVMLKKTANSIIDSLKENTDALRQTRQPVRDTPVYQHPASTQPAPQSEFTDDISQVVDQPEAKPLDDNPVSQQVHAFGEPEETFDNVTNNVQGFTKTATEANNIPKFGDKTILENLEKIHKQTTVKKPVRKVSTKPRSTRPRKK